MTSDSVRQMCQSDGMHPHKRLAIATAAIGYAVGQLVHLHIDLALGLAKFWG